MYEPSRHVSTFYVAGFQYWDGASVIGELSSGMGLDLAPERDNPHDPEAVAISWRGTKLGYVPADESGLVSTLAYYGHADVLECRVLKADPTRSPWHQLMVGIYVRDAR
ncbi:HIRAN domain-containing protein [Thermophilibacter sp. ZX-H3]|uniref:HIRAN domain-containing protein n=1 Tax=Atopobiaceae TaxID=1643824 RepID=UPI00094B518C|nr:MULTISPECIES: HIRAN domain-containing protein [Atopobiaceae]NJE80186.1 serine protease [Olsenella sp. SW781]